MTENGTVIVQNRQELLDFLKEQTAEDTMVTIRFGQENDSPDQSGSRKGKGDTDGT